MRVISLCPSLTDIFLHIGEGEPAGVTVHCEPQLDSVRVGSPKSVDFSAIDSVRPDLILADQNENRPEEIRELQKKYKVMTFDVRSVQAVLEAVSALGRALERNEEALRLIQEIGAAADTVKEKIKGLEPLPAQILLWNTPFLTVNFDTYASRIVEAAGGTNVFRQDPVREIPIEIEDMIDKDPKLLLLASDPYPFKKQHVKKFREYRVFSKIPIELVSGHYLSRYGPMTAEALLFFQQLIEKARAFAPGPPA